MAFDPTELLGGIGSSIGGLFGLGSMNQGYGKAREMYQKGADTISKADWQSGNAWDGATEDPAALAAQQAALARLSTVADSRGMDAGSQAAMQEGMDAVSQQGAADTGAIMQGAAMRGQVRSPMAAGAALVAGQGRANARAGYARGAVADARMRALNAMSGAGDMTTAIRGQGQQWGTAKNNAGNIIGMFNANQRGAQSQAVAGQYDKMADTYTGQGLANYNGAVAAGNSAGKAAGAAAGYAKLF